MAEHDQGRRSGNFSTPVGRPHAIPRSRDANQMSISFDNSKSYGSSSSMSVDSRGVAYGRASGPGGNRIATTYEGSDEEYAPDFEPDEGGHDGYGGSGNGRYHNGLGSGGGSAFQPSKVSRNGGGGGYEGKYSEDSKSDRSGGAGGGYSGSSGSSRRK